MRLAGLDILECTAGKMHALWSVVILHLPRGQWRLLSRFRTDAGPCRNSMHEWGYIASPLCDCGEPQPMRHVVNECPLTCFDGGISELYLAQDATFKWLLSQNLRSWKANDNNNNIFQMSSVMYVIIYLNIRERNIRTKINHHRRQHSAKSLLVQHYKTISNNNYCFLFFFLFCAGQLLLIIAHGMSGQEELVRR